MRRRPCALAGWYNREGMEHGRLTSGLADTARPTIRRLWAGRDPVSSNVGTYNKHADRETAKAFGWTLVVRWRRHES
jgi:hypothetical protein